jgi:hypothetical protein
MVNRYRRIATIVAELNLGELAAHANAHGVYDDPCSLREVVQNLDDDAPRNPTSRRR